MPSLDSAPPEIQSGRYELGELLHESPGASLYLGREKDTGLGVVLKCFPPGQQRAYLREASAALGLNHPNIVRCLDTFRLPTGGACVVYEYLPGGTLADHLEQAGPLATEEVWRCLAELAEGLAFLHGTGRIHCDLKPDNVFLYGTAETDSSRYVLGDLGAVSFLKEAKEGRRAPSTPAYVAPERVYDRYHCNSDLYSLGVLGFEIATGQRPFAGDAEAVIRAHLTQPPPLQRVADGAVRRVLECLLEKDPARRIQSADILLALIDQAHSGGVPVVESHDQPPAPEPERESIPLTPLASLGKCVLCGIYDISTTGLTRQPDHDAAASRERHIAPDDALPALGGLMESSGRVFVALDHGGHAVIQELGGAATAHVIAKTGRIRAMEPGILSFATSSRVFRFDPRRANATCVWEGCQGLLAHNLAHGFLLWQSRHGLEYVHLAQGRTHGFRAGSYLSPVKALILRGGVFCHSDGIANEQLVFRSPETEVLARLTLDGPILGLAGDDGNTVLAVVADMARGGRSLAACSPESSHFRLVRLPANLAAWCCTPGGVFWVNHDGGLHGAEADLEPVWLGRGLAESTAIRVSCEHRWLALLHHADDGARLALWNLTQPTEGRPS